VAEDLHVTQSGIEDHTLGSKHVRKNQLLSSNMRHDILRLYLQSIPLPGSQFTLRHWNCYKSSCFWPNSERRVKPVTCVASWCSSTV